MGYGGPRVSQKAFNAVVFRLWESGKRRSRVQWRARKGPERDRLPRSKRRCAPGVWRGPTTRRPGLPHFQRSGTESHGQHAAGNVPRAACRARNREQHPREIRSADLPHPARRRPPRALVVPWYLSLALPTVMRLAYLEDQPVGYPSLCDKSRSGARLLRDATQGRQGYGFGVEMKLKSGIPAPAMWVYYFPLFGQLVLSNPGHDGCSFNCGSNSRMD